MPSNETPARLGTGRIVAMLLVGTLAFLVLALIAPWAWQQLGGDHAATASAAAPEAGLPWQIERQAGGGSRVFGLDLGRSSLVQAGRRWPDEALKLAIVRDPHGGLTLEGYLERIQAGFVQGKLVLTGAVDAATLRRWAERAGNREIQPSGAHRLTLHADDEPAASATPIAGLVFLPAARFDEAVAVERFGTPPERLTTPDGTVHLLYPADGLVIALDPQGRAKPVLQYVAPRDFDRLKAPLVRPAV
jgi:hypothetical protein